MAIIVLQELVPDLGPGTEIPAIEAVHAAPADPDTPADPDDRTFCGKSTLDMERVPYEPAGPGALWLPPRLRRWACPDCAAALRA
ncbi:hypothetical protein [Streptomyces pseudogriseolus]|uniref:hypothetical protein n=1 Tax=Streptomyces pseudogriseolus TaxID=36817 RepID=UPI003FA3229C